VVDIHGSSGFAFANATVKPLSLQESEVVNENFIKKTLEGTIPGSVYQDLVQLAGFLDRSVQIDNLSGSTINAQQNQQNGLEILQRAINEEVFISPELIDAQTGALESLVGIEIEANGTIEGQSVLCSRSMLLSESASTTCVSIASSIMENIIQFENVSLSQESVLSLQSAKSLVSALSDVLNKVLSTNASVAIVDAIPRILSGIQQVQGTYLLFGK